MMNILRLSRASSTVALSPEVRDWSASWASLVVSSLSDPDEDGTADAFFLRAWVLSSETLMSIFSTECGVAEVVAMLGE